MKLLFKSSLHSYAISSILYLSILLLTACGGGGSDGGSNNNTDPNANTDPNSPVLNPIGSKSIVTGILAFTVTATDPNGLGFTFAANGSAGTNPFTVTGTKATFINDTNSGTGQFSWDTTTATAGDYYIEFSVKNTNEVIDSEIVKITVLGPQFILGEQKYNDNCQGCHGTGGIGGSKPTLQCISSVIFDQKVNGGSMTQNASALSDADKAAVLFYLQNIPLSSCAV